MANIVSSRGTIASRLADGERERDRRPGEGEPPDQGLPAGHDRRPAGEGLGVEGEHEDTDEQEADVVLDPPGGLEQHAEDEEVRDPVQERAADEPEPAQQRVLVAGEGPGARVGPDEVPARPQLADVGRRAGAAVRRAASGRRRPARRRRMSAAARARSSAWSRVRPSFTSISPRCRRRSGTSEPSPPTSSWRRTRGPTRPTGPGVPGRRTAHAVYPPAPRGRPGA